MEVNLKQELQCATPKWVRHKDGSGSEGCQELQCATPKWVRHEDGSGSEGCQVFEFVGVKQEQFDEAEAHEFLPQEPECIIVQAEDLCDDDERIEEADPAQPPVPQEPECIIVQNEEPCEDAEPCPTQEEECAAQQKPTGGVQGELILGLVPEEQWDPPCLPASDHALRDPLASEGDEIPDSMTGEFFMKGWSHMPENGCIPVVQVDRGQMGLVAENSLLPSYRRPVVRSSRSSGTETVQQAFRCDTCSTIFSSKYNLVIHVFTHITEVPPPSHVCRRCGEVFYDTASLIRHSLEHENNRQVPVAPPKRGKGSAGSGRPARGNAKRRIRKRDSAHVCDLCGKSFPLLGNLNSHKRTHSGERPYSCDVCGKSFVQSIHLRNHRVTHTAEKRHFCEFCGRPFALLHTLKVHMRMHTGETPYRCETCGAEFNLLGKLKTHQQSHTGKKPYQCDECGNRFAAPNSLKRHKRVHTHERPHSCEFCGEAFMWSATLRRHRQVHTGERPFGCDLCGSSFAELGGLNRHMRTHTGERPYVCDVCGASFTASNHMKRHREKHLVTEPS